MLLRVHFTPFLEIFGIPRSIFGKFSKRFSIFFSSGVSIPTKLTMGNPNFLKFFEKKTFLAILVPIFDCFWHLLHENLKFRHQLGLKIKNTPGKCCSE